MSAPSRYRVVRILGAVVVLPIWLVFYLINLAKRKKKGGS